MEFTRRTSGTTKGKAAFFVFLLVIGLGINFSICCRAYGEDRGTLWEVRNGENRAYIVGSIHMLKPENYPLGDTFEEAFSRAQVVVFEADLDRLNDPNTQQVMLQKAFVRDGSTLSRIIGEKAYEKAEMKARQVGISLASMEQFQPWFVCSTMALLKMVQMGYSAEYGLDQYFFEKAKNANKEIVGLETPMEQVEFLSGLSENQQKEFFIQTIEDLDIFEESLNEIIASWEQGNLDKLEKIMLESFRSHVDVYDRIVKQRNMNWFPRIDALLNSRQSTLIVVGAAHLLGKEGIVEMLRSKGYEVRQL